MSKPYIMLTDGHWYLNGDGDNHFCDSNPEVIARHVLARQKSDSGPQHLDALDGAGRFIFSLRRSYDWSERMEYCVKCGECGQLKRAPKEFDIANALTPESR